MRGARVVVVLLWAGCGGGGSGASAPDANLCGDGIVEAGETCDTGIASGTEACPASCTDTDPCTADEIVGGATCTSACVHTAIVDPASGDGCCPPGANAANDNECTPVCGNGVVEPGELCDGNCPTSCSDTDACTSDVSSGAGCQTACTHAPITVAANFDGCCPTGANANTDIDCTATCGNAVKEGNEQCDDGDMDNLDGCDVDCYASDMTCVGASAPTVATATITVSGIVNEIAVSGTTQPTVQPLASATVKLCKVGAACTGQGLLANATSANDGAFSLGPVSTGSIPLDAYVDVSKTAYRPTLVYPAYPFVADAANIIALAMSNTSFAAFSALLGVSQSPSDGAVFATVIDCAGQPLTNSAHVALTLKQNNTDVAGTTLYDLGALSPQSQGAYFVFNVPPGATVIGATYYGMPLASHTVSVVAATTTETLVRPGP